MDKISFTIQEFLWYFQEFDELAIPPNRQFEIPTIQEDQDSDPIDLPMPVPEDLGQKIIVTFNNITAVLAKSIALDCSKPLNVTINSDKVTLYSEGQFKLTAKMTDIYVKLTTLFEQMAIHSIKQMHFRPLQKLVVLGLSPEETALKATVAETLTSVIGKRLPSGFGIQFRNNPGITLESQSISYGEGTQNVLIISSTEEPLTFQLTENRKTPFTIKEFQKRIGIGKIDVPAGERLTIKDSDFQDLIKKALNNPLIQENARLNFILGQMFVYCGQSVAIQQTAEVNWTYKEEEGLTIWSLADYSLYLERGDIITTAEQLGIDLVENKRTKLILQPNQNLVFYELGERETTKIKTWITEPSQVLRGLSIFLTPHSPVGFILSLTSFKNLTCELKQVGEENLLILSSAEEWAVTLERSSGVIFALNLINDSSPDLLKGLNEGDSKAFIFMLFKALFHHCCGALSHFRNHAPSKFFKETTHTEIDILLIDENFANALDFIIQDENSNRIIQSILASSPEEFSLFDKETLPSELNLIMTKILELTYREMQGSPFLTDILARFYPQIQEEGNLHPYLGDDLG